MEPEVVKPSGRRRQVCRVLLLRGSKVYLVLRLDRYGARWIAPGGRPYFGESPAGAAVRELQEEVRLAVNVGCLERVLRRHDPMYNMDMVFYLCREWEGEPAMTGTRKFEGGVWVEIAELDSLCVENAHLGVYTKEACNLAVA